MTPLAQRADPLPIAPFTGPLDADAVVPGSKSVTNRALVVAALAAGRSTLSGVLFSDDTEAMIGALVACGYHLEVDEHACTVEVLGRRPAGAGDATVTIDARQSGTSARFLAPLLALDAGHRYVLDGAPQMRARPMGPGLDALVHLGAAVRPLGAAGHLPVAIEGASLAGGTVALPGDVSSQFVSGLLMAGPCMRDGVRIELTTELVSRPYLDLTVAVMHAFGAQVRSEGDRSFVARHGRYVGHDYLVEPDASAASYLFAAAAICGGRVRIQGLGRNTVQGDLRFVDVLEQMGATVIRHDDATEVFGGAPLRGVDVDMSDFSDTAQTLAAVAVFAVGPTRVRGIGFIRNKETDRIGAVVRELRRCGIVAEEETDGFVVHPGTPRPAIIETYDDHRMAMSFALLGLRVGGIEIANPGCVSKTFPGYWDALDVLRPR